MRGMDISPKSRGSERTDLKTKSRLKGDNHDSKKPIQDLRAEIDGMPIWSVDDLGDAWGYYYCYQILLVIVVIIVVIVFVVNVVVARAVLVVMLLVVGQELVLDYGVRILLLETSPPSQQVAVHHGNVKLQIGNALYGIILT